MEKVAFKGNNKKGNWRGVSATSSLLTLAYLTFSNVGYALTPMQCDVAIVGGGAAGMHTAFRLAQKPPAGIDPAKVCVFEKNDYLGGRIIDVEMGANGEKTGTAAYRMYKNHMTMKLALELGVPVQAQQSFKKLKGLHNPNGNTGNYFAYLGDFFKQLYNQAEYTDNDIWELLLCGPQVPKKKRQPLYSNIPGMGDMDPLAYLSYTLKGDQAGVKYFLDTYRFRSDFQTINGDTYDANSYMDFLADDYAGGATYYTVPGHSAIIAKMEDVVRQKNGKIELNQTVNSIKKSGENYTLTTNDYTVTAKHVVIATEADAIKNMTNKTLNDPIDQDDVIQRIMVQPQAQAPLGVKALTITHRWNRKWWQEDLRYPQDSVNGTLLGSQLAAADGNKIRRGETNIPVTGNYILNMAELPVIEYHDSINVTRTVYTDDQNQVDNWKTLANNSAALKEKVYASLHVLFPNVFSSNPNDPNNPQIEKTHVTYVPHAWYGLRKGSLAKGITNANIAQWAVNPLPGEKIYLAGDAWVPSYGWSASSLMSSVHLLNKHFGMKLDPMPYPRSECDNKGNIINAKFEDGGPNH